jgi:hypothetical protein
MKTAVVAAMAALSLIPFTRAQNLMGHVLPPGTSYVVVNTGNSDLDAAVQSAIADWNACLIGAKIVGVSPGDVTVPAYPNSRSEIYLTPLSEGEDGRTLYAQARTATQATLLRMQSHYVAEFDIQINSSTDWTPEDARRIVLHELGHVIGLSHPDEIGIDVPSVMRSGWNHPSPTITSADIAWVQALYATHPLQATLLQKITQARSIRRPFKRQRTINSCQRRLDQIALALFD